ncbi:pyridoxamine 5'-phosphate oxidase family protein [Isoptericola sp. NEAU-Y5]|uniref:Pyridoxamine 5'-phosphate oxidase family protein n=1 Tax=Isoptericola luteus TaxID=2879484 RepID=A0ABS7ZFZ4_9MICO|nr:MSMEG_1061 family FMN-dependent PPOX-type flavoprotein [Isoptericola sp. NEAU-Y5]MCA5893936.1 pyridoxamine 5'-phosphate oxidase family protein [Isoptericola sp. NEAU-Y5]
MDHGGTPLTSVAELEEVVGEPLPTARRKVRPRLHDLDRQWLAASPLCFVATADADGYADVSPKGDPAGFAHVLDDVTIALPERPGNRRADGFHNVLANPEVGLVFVVPGRTDTLRVNGTARVLRDVPYAPDLTVRGHVPTLVLEVSVREVFHHCPKAFLRSRLWDPETWAPDAVPRRAVLAQALERPDDTVADLDEYYGPAYAAKIYG